MLLPASDVVGLLTKGPALSPSSSAHVASDEKQTAKEKQTENEALERPKTKLGPAQMNVNFDENSGVLCVYTKQAGEAEVLYYGSKSMLVIILMNENTPHIINMVKVY